jgi:helix-turn-helix protein
MGAYARFQGFRLFWTWKSRRRTGRPTVPIEVRTLIRTMSEANPLWGAPRIHDELRKLGIDVSQATVAKYMGRRHQPPSQTWRTFLRITPVRSWRPTSSRPNGDLLRKGKKRATSGRKVSTQMAPIEFWRRTAYGHSSCRRVPSVR